MSIQTAGRPSARSPPTVVGVDLGLRNLVVAASADAGPEIDDTLTVDGELIRAYYDELGAVTTRLQAVSTDTLTAEACAFVWYRERIMQELASAAAAVLDYLDERNADVLALEDIAYPPKRLRECRHGDVDESAWILPAFQRRLEAVARAHGYRVELVAPEYTTQECHVCGVHGDKVRGNELQCIDETCPVETACRDESAAVTIAKRATANTLTADHPGGIANAD